MVFLSSTNNSPASDGYAIYILKTVMKLSSWTVISSSDGTTYNSSGDQITSGNSGTGGMNNNNAWFVIKKAPLSDGYTQEFCFQKLSATAPTYRIKYSFSAGFTGGSPSATQVPSASDENVIIGGGTNASPTGVNIFNTTQGSYRYSCLAGDGINDGYSVYSVAFPIGGGYPNHAFFFDRLLSGTYPTGENDPYVIFLPTTGSTILGNSSTPAINLTTSAQGPVCTFKAGYSSGSGFVQCPACFYVDTNTSNYFITFAGTDHINGQDDFLPVFYARRSALGSPSGWKGVSQHLYFTCLSRTTGDCTSISTLRDHIYMGNVIIPWDGSVAVI